MYSIGFRATPNCVHYCIMEKKIDELTIIDVNKISVPVKTDISFQLRYVKTNVNSILNEYKISKVGIRATENNARQISIQRIYIEGVIIETLEDSSVKGYFIGTKSKIASLLKEDVKVITQYISKKLDFHDIANWSVYCNEQRECIITATAAFEV